MPKVMTVEKAREFIVDVLEKEAIERQYGQMVADVLVAADLRGIDSHGLSRFPQYVKRINLGLIARTPKLTKVSSKGHTGLFDGNNSMGQISAYQSMEKAIELAKEHGTGVVATGNSNHFGIASFYSMMASQEDLIGFVSTNTSPLMAPFGGKEELLGTNPFTVAIPAGQRDDIVLDIATSQVSRGKMEVALREGEDLPAGWALDVEGRPTTDAQAGMDGTVMPLGGHKGYGMAIVIDILSGLLTRSAYLDEVGSFYGNDKKQNLGYFMIVIDPNIFIPIDQFKESIDAYIEKVKQSPKAPGVEEIFLPGEIEAQLTRKNEQNGVEVLDGLYAELKELANTYDLDFDDYL